MKYSIGVKGFSEYGLMNGSIALYPSNLDLFDSMVEVLVYLDEYASSLDNDLDTFNIKGGELCILRIQKE